MTEQGLCQAGLRLLSATGAAWFPERALGGPVARALFKSGRSDTPVRKIDTNPLILTTCYEGIQSFQTNVFSLWGINKENLVTI
ncbi:MAG: hypothetical protein RI973_1726 [Bacteroidota bacterium]|jgi:hypothetical protein